MCKTVKLSTGSVEIPLTEVNWTKKESQILTSDVEPNTTYYYFHAMNYFYLAPKLSQWFDDIDAEYRIYFDHLLNTWILEIYDIAVAVLYKLTFP